MPALLAGAMDGNSPVDLVIPLGVNGQGETISLDLLSADNCLIVYPKWMIGESVLLKTIVTAILARNTPRKCRLIISDIVKVGLELFDGIPHLLTSVITEPDRTISALQWLNGEVQKRKNMFLEFGVDSIGGFNKKAGFVAMNYLVVVTHDLGECVAVAPSKFIELIEHIHIDARRVGVILIATTREPRRKVTKNFHTRITYKARDPVGVVNYLAPGADKTEKLELVKIPEEEKLTIKLWQDKGNYSP